MISAKEKAHGIAVRFRIVLCSRKGRFPPQGRGAHSFLEKNPPHTPEEKHQGVSTSPWTPNDTKGEGCGPLPLETLSRGRGTEVGPPPLETPPGVGRGSGSGKKGRGRPVWNIGVRRTFWCGDTVPGGIGIAQPVGDFWIWSAVCDGQPPVLGDLTPSCQITPQRFFFCTVSGTFSFWQDKKKMWGTFCTAKPCLPVPHSGTVVHPCGDSPHILGSPFQGEPFKGALQWPNVNPPPI